MGETYAKYSNMENVATCLLIDEPPVVLLGRTFSELTGSVVGFVACAYVNELGLGVVMALVVGGVLPMYRVRFPRGYLLHLCWALGLAFREEGLFTLRRGVKVLGP